VSISKFQITTQIRQGRWKSNQIEFWVLIYYKFKILGLTVLFVLVILVPTTIDWDQIHVRISHIIIGIILYILLLVPPADSIFSVSWLYHYINKWWFNNGLCLPYRIGDQGPVCYDRTGEILIGRDNVKKSFSSKEDEVGLYQCLSWRTRWSMNKHGSGLNGHSPSSIN